MVIYKYELPIIGDNILMIPKGASILTAQMQGGKLCLWVEVNPDRTPQARHFVVVGTGWDVPKDTTYIATVQVGFYVWHVYEVGR